ncbi:WhiB family transcription factor [Mycobacterium phage Winky]|uniref:WhiB family transcription factor n=1 Tax=Mycobacterium phage Faith1 TaxID=2920893 RepID=F6M877_9CAUD|nr:WhiB transcriptional factor [Mycobacterium phage Faith1]AGK87645.1 WhiB family transcription factor [Mycobacterium phage Winky]AGM12691.1 WhiB family transcription factor [Mycobacterium phage Breezona]ASM62688.1 WhiB family transcription factor [Mycobacterium phage Miley16]AYN57128.1 WhiB family transcription factor [Mycobacterium phage BigCheese]QGJ93955.1 WhiB family transcription factor [Mycobacterium phage BobsGarage]QGZ16594.1 WhiB family transcription factor [Mycobacterium phage Gabr
MYSVNQRVGVEMRFHANQISRGNAFSIPVTNVSGVRSKLIPELDIPDLPGAACKGTVTDADDDPFFPKKGAGGRKQIAEARAVCNGCSAKRKCLEAALKWDRAHPDYFDRTQGVWGGTTEAERQEILKEENNAA